MHIHAGIEVSVRFIGAHGTVEEFTPLLVAASCASEREPLALGTASGAVLRCPVCIGFCGHDPHGIGFLARILIDLAAQLIGLFAVPAPRFARPFRSDLAQAFKEQDTVRILCTDSGNAARYPMSRVVVHPADMSPELLVAVLAFDRLARLPLLFGDPLEMVIALLIQPVIRKKDCLYDSTLLSDRDDGQLFHIQVHSDRHQIRIQFALFDFLGRDLLGL